MIKHTAPTIKYVSSNFLLFRNRTDYRSMKYMHCIKGQFQRNAGGFQFNVQWSPTLPTHIRPQNDTIAPATVNTIQPTQWQSKFSKYSLWRFECNIPTWTYAFVQIDWICYNRLNGIKPSTWFGQTYMHICISIHEIFMILAVNSRRIRESPALPSFKT